MMKTLKEKMEENIAKNKLAKENGTLDMSQHPQLSDEESMKIKFNDLVLKAMTSTWINPNGLATVKTIYAAYVKLGEENFNFEEGIKIVEEEMQWNDFLKKQAEGGKMVVIA